MSRTTAQFVATLASALAGVSLCTTVALAQTTATVVGTVKDAQGAVIPGATITLLSEGRGTGLDTVTNTDGDFTFSNVIGDTYTIKISMDGFKTSERKGIAVSPGARVVVPFVTLEVGTLEETVLVAGQAPLIQTQTGDRSFSVAKAQVENLPNSGRNFASFAALIPGVVSTVTAAGTNTTITRLGGGTTNYLLDGITNVDPGGNGQGIQLNMDAIAEVTVLASAYQAEYGRSNGLQISGVTKSGTNQFHGSFYDLERNSDWNANSWSNVKNNIAKPVLKQRDFGFTVGGPIGKPGGKNSLFFFFSHQFSPLTTEGVVNLFRVPTLLERQGDFSQSTDNTGALFPYIRDASTGLPCSAADTRGCFQDGGVLGRIPKDRLYALGLNTLKYFPEPNTTGLNFNLRTIQPRDSRLTQQPMARIDYQASGKFRVSGKLAAQIATSKPMPGTLPGFNDFFQKLNSRYAPSVTGVYTLNSTTIAETSWGMNYDNQLNPLVNNAATNRCNYGLCDIPLLFPKAGVVPPDTWDYAIIQKTGSPFFVNGEVLLPPDFTWGSRITNQPPNLEYRNNIDFVRTHDVAGSITKLMGRHTAKAGIQWDHMLKVQIYGASGSIPFQGIINFGNDSNNPLDTGFGYANAALGIFSSFSQQARFIEGHWIYDSIEGYMQDNWKLNDRLTLDYGVRITHQGPNYDTKQQPSNFFPDQWSASRLA
jgi:Carboxypeptidase regulatory-like domain/TonB-dependent Receptor Plug Domain